MSSVSVLCLCVSPSVCCWSVISPVVKFIHHVVLHHNACINWFCIFLFFSFSISFLNISSCISPFASIYLLSEPTHPSSHLCVFHILCLSCCNCPHVIVSNFAPTWLHCPFLCIVCVNGWHNSPNEIPSLDAPSPSPTPPLEPQTQIQLEHQSVKDLEEGEQTATTPCIEIHSASVRRSSEPLPCILPRPHAEPPTETVTHLTVTSEQRSSP